MEVGKIMDGLIAMAAESIPQEADDYIEDGLLYCGKCRTQKQCRINMLGREAVVFCLCKCAKEKQETEEAELKQREHLRRLDSLRRTGFPDSDMLRWTFDTDDGGNGKLTQIAKAYVENFAKFKADGKGLLLFGTVGTGKTFAAACIANALIDKGVACMVSSMARIVNMAQACESGRQAYLDSLNRFDLLVIDDLSSERETEYMTEMVQSIIDARYRAHKPLIVTTNLTGDELKSPEDMSKQRIYSRLFEMCIPYEVKGDDRRKKKLTNDYSAYKDLLGL